MGLSKSISISKRVGAPGVSSFVAVFVGGYGVREFGSPSLYSALRNSFVALVLLAFLARNLRVDRVLIVGTYRTDDLVRGHPLLLVELHLRPRQLLLLRFATTRQWALVGRGADQCGGSGDASVTISASASACS